MTPPTTIRLTDTDRENAAKLVKAGLAIDLTGAIRVALALVASRIVKGR